MTQQCPAQTFAHLIREVSTLWREIVDRRLEPLGLSAARWQPLLVLHRADTPLSQAALAGALEIEAPTLVRLLDRLSRDGWVERLRCPQDRRAHRIVLTPKARAACDDIEQVLEHTRQEVLSSLSRQEVAQCVDLLERVRQRAQHLRYDGEPPPENPLRAVLRKPRKSSPAAQPPENA